MIAVLAVFPNAKAIEQNVLMSPYAVFDLAGLVTGTILDHPAALFFIFRLTILNNFATSILRP